MNHKPHHKTSLHKASWMNSLKSLNWSKIRNHKTHKNSNKNKNHQNPKTPSIRKPSCTPSKALHWPETSTTKNSRALNSPVSNIESAKGTIKFIYPQSIRKQKIKNQQQSQPQFCRQKQLQKFLLKSIKHVISFLFSDFTISTFLQNRTHIIPLIRINNLFMRKKSLEGPWAPKLSKSYICLR